MLHKQTKAVVYSVNDHRHQESKYKKGLLRMVKKQSYLYMTHTKENLFLKSKAFITFSLRNIMMIFRPKNAPSTYPPAGKE